MSACIRFADANDVFAAFPRLETMAARPTGPCEPLAHARHLIASPRPAGNGVEDVFARIDAMTGPGVA